MKFNIIESFKLEDIDFKKVFVNAGRAYEKQKKEEDVDPEELEMGIKVEMEHTTNEDIAKRIALDHLSENIPNYYTLLAKMEDKAKKEGEKDAEDSKEKEEEGDEKDDNDGDGDGKDEDEDEEEEEESSKENSMRV